MIRTVSEATNLGTRASVSRVVGAVCVGSILDTRHRVTSIIVAVSEVTKAGTGFGAERWDRGTKEDPSDKGDFLKHLRLLRVSESDMSQ